MSPSDGKADETPSVRKAETSDAEDSDDDGGCCSDRLVTVRKVCPVGVDAPRPDVFLTPTPGFSSSKQKRTTESKDLSESLTASDLHASDPTTVNAPEVDVPTRRTTRKLPDEISDDARSTALAALVASRSAHPQRLLLPRLGRTTGPARAPSPTGQPTESRASATGRQQGKSHSAPLGTSGRLWVGEEAR